MMPLMVPIYIPAVTTFIINKNKPFGNEKHLNCEKIINLLKKYFTILPFFYISLKKNKRNNDIS